MPDSEWQSEKIREVGGRRHRGHVADGRRCRRCSYFECNGNRFTRQVDLIGIDEKTQSSVSDFGKYLQHPANREAMSFDLREDGYDVRDHQGDGTTPEREQMADGRAWHAPHATMDQAERLRQTRSRSTRAPRQSQRLRRHSGRWRRSSSRRSPRTDDRSVRTIRPEPMQRPEHVFDPAKQQHTGAVLGIAMASYRDQGRRRPVLHAVPGDDVKIAVLHGRPAAEDRQRQLHDRRFLRKQDERVRREVRLRADPQVAGAARHDRSDDRRRSDQRHPDQAEAGRRRRCGARQASQRHSTRRLYGVYTWRDKQGAAAGRRRSWKRASSTCCCS